ncbi:dehydration-responsive element-binding protein 1F-like [Telopea speciosissima]|uniref:dehydration-responsive element-binding protein 1F-like n=1 Tax=Telopea speciosissima TaxID=54955 RepID=UPI001CC40CFE|nr:dehydration-responsive element-binding protein 1F-like [Telopea speciosissima]
METFEEESSASSSSSEIQASKAVCNNQINTEPPELEQVPQVAAAASTTNIIITQKRKAGRKKFRETRHPIFRGVRERNGGKWVCEVREPNKKSRIWLGTFPSPDMAARAYDVAAIALRGKSAILNFPDSEWILPRAKSSSPRDIQVAALQAAESFPPHPHTVTSSCSSFSSSTTSSPTASELPHVNEGKKGEITENSTGGGGERAAGESVLFVDEEKLFNMPVLIDSMAEGMLLTPPSMNSWDDVDCQVNWSLWSY